MATFSERIKSLRLSKNKTQAELAEHLKVSKSIISMYERGERVPGYEMQEALADYFNVDLDYLVGRSDRTAVVFEANGSEPERRYLMDRIAKADSKKLNKIKKLMELIDDEEQNNWR